MAIEEIEDTVQKARGRRREALLADSRALIMDSRFASSDVSFKRLSRNLIYLIGGKIVRSGVGFLTQASVPMTEEEREIVVFTPGSIRKDSLGRLHPQIKIHVNATTIELAATSSPLTDIEGALLLGVECPALNGRPPYLAQYINKLNEYNRGFTTRFQDVYPEHSDRYGVYRIHQPPYIPLVRFCHRALDLVEAATG